jgi:hypothetical protein
VNVREEVLTPDFIDHRWCPLERAWGAGGFVHLRWPDGVVFAAYSLGLA